MEEGMNWLRYWINVALWAGGCYIFYLGVTHPEHEDGWLVMIVGLALMVLAWLI